MLDTDAIKGNIKNIALQSGAVIGGLTPRQEILGFIERLRPLRPGRGLRRFGPETDGGYLMPDDLEGVGACISPGVSTESRFDLEIAERGIDVYLADASVEGPSVSHQRFHFTKKFLGAHTEGEFVSIDDFCGPIQARNGRDFIMQMDIEGAEYMVLPEMSDALLKSFRIIVIEVHNLESIFAVFPFRIINVLFDKLLRHHHVVHIHPNNCCGVASRHGLQIPRVMEFTFYRKDRDQFAAFEGRIPERHVLDGVNVVGKPELVLPDCWR
jgi:hypothetical protein